MNPTLAQAFHNARASLDAAEAASIESEKRKGAAARRHGLEVAQGDAGRLCRDAEILVNAFDKVLFGMNGEL